MTNSNTVKTKARPKAPQRAERPSKPRPPQPACNGSGKPKASKKRNEPPKAPTPSGVADEIAVVPSQVTPTWDSFVEFKLELVAQMSSSELAAEIISRLPYIDEALTQMNAWVGRSLWLAWQIGHLALAAKKQVEHGQFGEWCRVNVPPLTDRTVQRYMKVAKTTAVSDIKGKSLTEVYHKLGILVEEDRATRTEKQPDLTAEHVFKLPELLARLKSSREFLSACTEEIPFENLEISVIDECAAEFAALSALCERMQRKIAEATAAKPVTGVEIPVDNVNGLSRPTFATTPQEGLEAMGDSTGQS